MDSGNFLFTGCQGDIEVRSPIWSGERGLGIVRPDLRTRTICGSSNGWPAGLVFRSLA